VFRAQLSEELHPRQESDFIPHCHNKPKREIVVAVDLDTFEERLYDESRSTSRYSDFGIGISTPEEGHAEAPKIVLRYIHKGVRIEGYSSRILRDDAVVLRPAE
jgi:hypothetical protein